MRAFWNGQIVAESDDTVVVENNHYFPVASLKEGVAEKTTHTSGCPWKGTASYFTLVVDGQRNENAAWTYPDPKDKAENIRDRVAFWKGVEVRE